MRAFSLVELSIVLVILGLLTGGILAGQSLIQAAQLRAVTTEYHRYSAALYAFRDKYRALPGDFRDATRFWNRQKNDTACVTRSSASVDTAKGVCDGDGDGVVSGVWGAPDTAYTARESLQAWRHLAAAGLIEGTWPGETNSSGYLDDKNQPPSRMKNAVWGFRVLGDLTGDMSGTNMEAMFALNYRNGLELWSWSTPVLTPQEAWSVDVKSDDGMPARGNIIAHPWSVCTLATSRTQFDAAYNLANTTKVCSTLFFRGF